MVCELFFARISWNSNDWIVRNRQVSAKAISLNFSSNFACAAFNWVLSILRNLRIAGFFALLPFLTYLCYKRLKPSNTLRSITKKNSKDRAGIEQIKWLLHQLHVCFLQSLCKCWILWARAHVKTVFGHLKGFIFYGPNSLSTLEIYPHNCNLAAKKRIPSLFHLFIYASSHEKYQWVIQNNMS